MNKQVKALLANSSASLGYIIGAFIFAPALMYFVVSPIFFSFQTNGQAKKYVNLYVQDSDTILFHFPKKSKDINIDDEYYYFNLLSQSHITGYRNIFYSDSLQKYVALINFNGTDYDHNSRRDWGAMRQRMVVTGGISFFARVNRQQLEDDSYGSAENPLPIFWYRCVSGRLGGIIFGIQHWGGKNGRERTWVEYPDKPFEYLLYLPISDSSNNAIVERYLERVMSKKEFKRLFGDDLKNK